MRVATWNIRHGTARGGGRLDLPGLRAGVAALAADVLAVQEVDHGQPRSQRMDLTSEVADAAGAAEARFLPTLVGTPGRRWRAAGSADARAAGSGTAGSGAAGAEPGTADPQPAGSALSGPELAGFQPAGSGSEAGRPQYGIGLVSRCPVRSWHELRLAAPGTRWWGDEPRAALAAVVETPAGTWTVAATHLSILPGRAARQLRRLSGWLTDFPLPHLVLGDLNLPAGRAAAAAGMRCLAREPTFPARRPFIQLDHVLARGDLPAGGTLATPRLPVSDHRALIVTWPGDRP